MNRTYGSSARWLLTAPLLVFLAAIVAFPLAYGLLTSLRDRTLLFGDQGFAGLNNYLQVLQDSAFWGSVRFTILFTVVTVVLELALGLGLALIFNQNFPGKRFLMTCVLLPIMVASSLLAVLWRLGLNENIGLIPALFGLVGVELRPFSTSTVIPTLITADVLHWTPLVFLLCYAGLQSIPSELYEAARIDGAGYWRIHRSIVFPLLLPVIAIAAFLRGVDAAKQFDLIYVMTGGGPGSLTTNTNIYIYKAAFVDGNFGLASAASVLMLLLMLVLVPLVVRRTTRN